MAGAIIVRPVMRSSFLLSSVVSLLLGGFAHAQTDQRLMLKPWPADTFIETNDHLLYQAEANVRGEDANAQVFWWDSQGRWRFDPHSDPSAGLGYRWLTMGFDTNSDVLPDHLDEISMALGFPLGELAGGSLSIVGGAGYASNNPFADTNGIFGIGHIEWQKPLDSENSIVVGLDYNGNSSFLPDAPLPGFEFVHRTKPLSFGIGFPQTWVQWEILPKLTIDANYDVPLTANATVAYHFTEQWSVFGGYSHFFNGFFIDDVPKTERLFYEMSRVETGVRFEGTIFGFYTDAAVTVGYAFEQNFQRGFDVRNLDNFSSISDEPYIGLVLIGRF